MPTKPLGYVPGDDIFVFHSTGYKVGKVTKVSPSGHVSVSTPTAIGTPGSLRFTPKGNLFGDGGEWSRFRTHILPRDAQNERAKTMRAEIAVVNERHAYRAELERLGRLGIDDSTRPEIAAALRALADKLEKGP